MSRKKWVIGGETYGFKVFFLKKKEDMKVYLSNNTNGNHVKQIDKFIHSTNMFHIFKYFSIINRTYGPKNAN